MTSEFTGSRGSDFGCAKLLSISCFVRYLVQYCIKFFHLLRIIALCRRNPHVGNAEGYCRAAEVCYGKTGQNRFGSCLPNKGLCPLVMPWHGRICSARQGASQCSQVAILRDFGVLRLWDVEEYLDNKFRQSSNESDEWLYRISFSNLLPRQCLSFQQSRFRSDACNDTFERKSLRKLQLKILPWTPQPDRTTSMAYHISVMFAGKRMVGWLSLCIQLAALTSMAYALIWNLRKEWTSWWSTSLQMSSCLAHGSRLGECCQAPLASSQRMIFHNADAVVQWLLKILTMQIVLPLKLQLAWH